TGYMISEHKLYKTVDASSSWHRVITPSDSLLQKVHFIDSENGFIAGKKLYKTESGTLPTAIRQFPLQAHFKIYPNPASQTLSLEYDNNVQLQSIQLINVTGKITRIFNKKKKILELVGLASGVYFLHIKAQEGSLIEQIVIR